MWASNASFSAFAFILAEEVVLTLQLVDFFVVEGLLTTFETLLPLQVL